MTPDEIARLRAVEAENTRLRAALAMSDRPCAYCSLPADEWAKCPHGFPGCARGDDAMGCPHLGASLEVLNMKAEIERLRKQIADDADDEALEVKHWANVAERQQKEIEQLRLSERWPFATFKEGDRVRKKSGSSWHGRVVGWYSTALTPEGYVVESEREPGSAQIYPVAALEITDEW